MPQTRFVTRKALALGLKPIVVVNKIDRPGARAEWVVNQTFNLFDKLGASEAQLDFPVVYASALEGWATTDLARKHDDLQPLFEAILANVPVRNDDPDYREANRGKRGLGPQGYKRSDERISDDAHERLTDDTWLDASNRFDRSVLTNPADPVSASRGYAAASVTPTRALASCMRWRSRVRTSSVFPERNRRTSSIMRR